VTVSRPYDAAATESLAQALSKALGKNVVPHVTVDERIIGGVVVRVGDQVMDGSIKRRIGKLRTALVGHG
jgi:F-type H+-transporting ATPase subunit delta